jgi:hypothetical protein
MKFLEKVDEKNKERLKPMPATRKIKRVRDMRPLKDPRGGKKTKQPKLPIGDDGPIERTRTGFGHPAQ